MFGCEKKESEVENSESEESPQVEGKSKVRSSKVKEPKKGVSKKKANHESECLFCTYHCENMLERKYSKPEAPKEPTTESKDRKSEAAKESTPACHECNVIFLLYCINCDDVFLCYTDIKLKFLMDLNFGFHWYEKCQPGKSHERRYLRCMIIDKLNVPINKEFTFSMCTLIDVVQKNSKAYFLQEMKTEWNVEVIEKPDLTKNEFKIETPNYLKMWDHFLQLKQYLNIQILNEKLSEMSTILPVIDLNDKFEVYRRYHYVPRSKFNELGPNPKTLVYNSKNIVYMIICSKCGVKYVGRTEDTFLFRYPYFLAKATIHVQSHFKSGECTIRDMQWTVIDTLSDDQIYFLHRGSYVFNKCELDVKKLIWGMMNMNLESKYIELLKENLLDNNSFKEAIKKFKEETQGLIDKEKLDKHFWQRNVANDELEIFLRMENEKWIKNTKTLFIEDKENFWMVELQTLENGLNQKKGARSKDSSPNFYNDFFTSMSYFKVET